MRERPNGCKESCEESSTQKQLSQRGQLALWRFEENKMVEVNGCCGISNGSTVWKSKRGGRWETPVEK